jgi:hypothetical protein
VAVAEPHGSLEALLGVGVALWGDLVRGFLLRLPSHPRYVHGGCRA